MKGVYVISAIFFQQIMKEDVDECRKVADSALQFCKLAIDWKGDDLARVPVLKRRVNLVGAKAPNNFFVLHIVPQPLPPPPATERGQ